MAGGDYKLCDVCGWKAFYDAELQYDTKETQYNIRYPWTKEAGKVLAECWRYKLPNVGDWAVLCGECSKTHKTQIVLIQGEK